MNIHHVGQFTCPECRTPLNAVTGVSGRDMPKHGDLCVCFKCAAVLQYENDFKFVVAPQDVLLSLEPGLQQYLQTVRSGLRSLQTIKKAMG